MTDPINNPAHYTHAGIECRDINQSLCYNLGCAFKYLYRAGHKANTHGLDDLLKAENYLQASLAKEGFFMGLTIQHDIMSIKNAFSNNVHLAMYSIVLANNQQSSHQIKLALNYVQREIAELTQ